LWVVLFRDRLQLVFVISDALRKRAYLCSKMGPRAGQSASGKCSAAFLWKLLAGHLGNLPPKDFTAPRTLGLPAACGNRLAPGESGLWPYEPGSLRLGV
jgi:hypothetical protein